QGPWEEIDLINEVREAEGLPHRYEWVGTGTFPRVKDEFNRLSRELQNVEGDHQVLIHIGDHGSPIGGEIHLLNDHGICVRVGPEALRPYVERLSRTARVAVVASSCFGGNWADGLAGMENVCALSTSSHYYEN